LRRVDMTTDIKYTYADVFEFLSSPFDTIEEAITDCESEHEDPKVVTFYMLVPGIYTPPGAPGTVRFPDMKGTK